MLVLTVAGTDKLQLTRSSTADVDVHVSWVDIPAAGGTGVVGRTNTAFNTAATGDILATPAASTNRIVKHINIRNKHATTTVDVTVLFDQNGTGFELHKATLLVGEVLEYQEGVGWFVVQTVRKDVFYRMVSGADYVNATTSFSDITGLTAPVKANINYNFTAHLYHIENASTTGARFGINGPALTSARIHELGGFAGAVGAGTMQANVGDVTALDTAAIAATSSAGTPQVIVAILSGWAIFSAAGTFAVRGQSEVAVAAGLTVKVGSWLKLWETPS